MPAPLRPGLFTTEPNAINVPRGIVGVYTDAEADAELASLRTWVTEQITNAATGGTIDLSDYATGLSLTEAVQDLTLQITARYMKDEIDSLLLKAEGDWTSLVASLDTEIKKRPTLSEVEALLAALPAVPDGAITVHDEELPAIGNTPQEAVETLRPYAQGCHWFARSRGLMLLNRDPLLDGEQVVITTITPGQTVEAKLVAYVPPTGSSSVTPSLIVITGAGRVTRLEAATLTDEFNLKGSGDPVTAVTQPQLAAAIAAAKVDMSPYAKRNDPKQAIYAEEVRASYLSFDAVTGLSLRDTNEGYGERLYFSKGLALDGVVLKSDLDPFYPRIKALEDGAVTASAPCVTNEEVVDGWQVITLTADTVFTNGANIPIIRRVLGDAFQIVGEALTLNSIPTDGWFQVGTIPRPFWPNRNTPDFTIGTTDAGYLPGFALCYVASDGKVWIKPSLVAARHIAFNNVVLHYPSGPLRDGDEPSGEYITDRTNPEAT